jgi:hypothetical protein
LAADIDFSILPIPEGFDINDYFSAKHGKIEVTIFLRESDLAMELHIKIMVK